MSQVMTPSTETGNHFLTSKQLQQFEHDGYLRVEGVIDPEAFIDPLFADYALVLDRLANELHDRGEIDSTFDDLPFGDRMIRVYQASGRDHARYFDCSLPNRNVKPDTHMWLGPSVFHLLTHPGVLDVVESVIGPEITSNPVQHVRIKPPEKALPDGATDVLVRANPWHQDNGVVDPIADETHMLTVWISLSAATPENGCLRVIPGSHRGALRTHCLNPVAIPDALLELDRVTPVPTEPGDVIIFNKYTCHGSGPNVSDHFRVSLDLRYNPTGQPTGRPAFPDFVARSRHDPSSVLTDPAAWAQLWYDARTRLAEKGENFAFRWRGDEPVCA
ncbi:MAG: phytanoyl-CoA dioxygenase family protein [Chloroflexota bacterium]|nr:phytanoyl-CoA dioxygenase family protein [Chloroflexota bacterium]